MAIITRSSKGSALTHEEMDNNFTQLKEWIDNLQSPVVVKEVNLTVGDNVIVHGTGKMARMVTSFLTGGVQAAYAWRRDPADQLNNIILFVPEDTPAPEMLRVEVNILIK